MKKVWSLKFVPSINIFLLTRFARFAGAKAKQASEAGK